MEFAQILVAIIFAVLAVAHTVLGERGVIRPLLAADWDIDGLPRWAADRLLRFAWHLPTVAWLALGGVMLGWSPFLMVALGAAGTALLILIALPGHAAWPLMALAAGAAWWADGSLTESVLRATGLVTAAVLVGAALLHVYWAFGGTWITDRVYPPRPGKGPSAVPGRWLTLAVAVLLGGFAGLVATAASGETAMAVRWLVAAGTAVLVVRAVGDGKTAGFTKSDRSTAFAVADDRYFTPLVVFLSMGATSAFLVGI